MADLKAEVPEDKIAEIVRAVNVQARLLAEIVKAADHVVKAYIELTKVEVPKDEKKEESVKEVK
jgi:hypothetical protein